MFTTYNRIFWVNFQDLTKGCVCFTVVVLTEGDKGPGGKNKNMTSDMRLSKKTSCNFSDADPPLLKEK